LATDREKIFPLDNSNHGSLFRSAVSNFSKKKIGIVSLAVIIVLYGWGITAQWTTPYGYDQQDLSRAKIEGRSLGCASCEGPTLKHPFGTDRLGRDVLTRIVFGLRTTVIVTVVGIATGSLFFGIILGLAAGYMGKTVDAVIMRIGEIFLAFPGLLLVLIIASTIRPRVVELVKTFEDITGIEGIIRLGIVDYFVVFGAMAAFSWVGTARLVRGQVLSIKETPFVEAARATGASTRRILLLHILPNIMSPLIVLVSMGMGAAVGTEIILGWLGIGIQPPTPSIGVMIFENGNIGVLRSNPHLILFPVGVVTVLIFTFNLLGDAINDAFNPRVHR